MTHHPCRGGGFCTASPSRSTSLARPWRDKPSSRAARLRLPPARASASCTNARSNAPARLGQRRTPFLRRAAESPRAAAPGPPRRAAERQRRAQPGRSAVPVRSPATRGPPAPSSCHRPAVPARASASGCDSSSAWPACRRRRRERATGAPADAPRRGGTTGPAGTVPRPPRPPGCGWWPPPRADRAGGVTFSPTFRISPSCSVRSSFACARGDSSPTSSRKTVPPEEASSRPRRECTAPVNAPFA